MTVIACLTLPNMAQADERCSKLKAKKPFVYAVGSSTMGSYLGSYLKRDLPKAGFKFRKWAKASSGLARPDFHDWPERLPEITKQWKPDVYVIALGTNDFQPLKHKGKWVDHFTPEWETIYTARVDRLLELAGAKGRVVVWVGPAVFDQPRARKMAKIVNDIVKARIAKYKGAAFHVDVFGALMGKGKRPAKRIAVGKKKTLVYSRDGVHMTREAIQQLMVKPTLAILKSCKRGGVVTQK